MLAAKILSRLILVSAVMLTMLLLVNQVYYSAAGLAVGLLAYGYLVLWGDEALEERVV
jgi:hypothetical protein